MDPELLKQLIETFKIELEEQLQVIVDGLLALEKDAAPQNVDKVVTSIFRGAHNIKGTARSLGIKDVSEIAHHVESIFSAVQKKTLAMSTTMTNLCLEAVDKMRSAMQCFVNQSALNFNLEEFLQQLDDVQTSSQTTQKTIAIKSLDEIETATKKEPALQNTGSLRVSVANIDRMSAFMEDMQVNKIAIDEHYRGLLDLVNKTNQFAKVWQQIIRFNRSSEVENILKLSNQGADYFTEMMDTTFDLQKNMRIRLNDLSLLSNALQEEIRTLRLVPLANLLSMMPRYVRDLSQQLNKKVNLTIRGEEVKIDKMVLEKLKDPIIHLLRNSVDHGIEDSTTRLQENKKESGQISIDIREEANQIVIKITDDGAGMDLQNIKEIAVKKNFISPANAETLTKDEIIELIFLPSFSSKEMITDISGRGVGLDVVKTNIENLNGRIKVDTHLGKGTTFELFVPLTLASERGLMIASSSQLFAIPVSAVMRVLTVDAAEIYEVEGIQTILLEGHPLPLMTLSDLLHLEQHSLKHTQFPVIVININKNPVAILVEEIIGEREIVIKPLHPPLQKALGIAGGTLSANNQVIPVLNPNDLINLSLHIGKSQSISLKEEEIIKPKERPRILVVDDSITTRTLEKNILESKNYDVTVAVNGKEAWDLLQKYSFSLVITDISMPIMDGFALTEKVKSSDKLKNLPVIIVTSLGSDAEKKRGIDVGADAYIVKHEFESSALLEIVGQLI